MECSIDRLRQIDPERLIIIGGNNYNAVDERQNIQVRDNTNLLHTFHFYLPMLVTHQRAPWVKAMDFGLVDQAGQIVSKDLVEAVTFAL